jgi:ADP-ribose pyrophosphatase YjhB (NUDIX family)
MIHHELLEEIKRLKAIADIGLLYCNNEFDKERYLELSALSINMLHHTSEQSIETLKAAFVPAADYPTAKVDVRGMVLSADKKILLVQESADGKWSLPGGWADIGQTPTEVIIKEMKEETGLDVAPKALLAVFDKRAHPHPPQPFYVYKMVFYCTATSAELDRGFDLLDVQYFDVNNLPPLSEDRILQSQIELVYNKIIASDFTAYVD